MAQRKFLIIGNLVNKILIFVIYLFDLFTNFQILINYSIDFEGVGEFLEEKIPCYILYRLDSKSSTGDYEWLFMTYVPDLAKVCRNSKSYLIYPYSYNVFECNLG
jgi:hypothetical protein